jgi:hypothetical protein
LALTTLSDISSSPSSDSLLVFQHQEINQFLALPKGFNTKQGEILFHLNPRQSLPLPCTPTGFHDPFGPAIHRCPLYCSEAAIDCSPNQDQRGTAASQTPTSDPQQPRRQNKKPLTRTTRPPVDQLSIPFNWKATGESALLPSNHLHLLAKGKDTLSWTTLYQFIKGYSARQ